MMHLLFCKGGSIKKGGESRTGWANLEATTVHNSGRIMARLLILNGILSKVKKNLSR